MKHNTKNHNNIKLKHKSINNLIDLIIINYNSTIILNKLLKSTEKIEEIINKIIIFDNNSKDIEKIKAKNSKIILIKNKKNIGFGKAINKAIKQSETTHFILINPDSKIIQKKSIKKLIKIVKINNKIGIAGGKITYNKNRNEKLLAAHRKPNFFHALFNFTILRKIFPNNFFVKNFWYQQKNIKKISEVDCLNGSFMIIQKKAFNDVGGFDSNFFLYFEDIDLCNRIKKINYKIIYDPNVKTYHYGGYSNKSNKHIDLKNWYKSRKYYFQKSFPFPLNYIIKIIFNMEEKSIKITQKIKQIIIKIIKNESSHN